MDACVRHGVRRFVLSSTANLYGEPKVVPIPEDAPLSPHSPYGESKHMIERALYWADRVYGLRSACLRYFNAAPKVDEVANDHQVNLSYAKPGGQSFVSISGTARLVRDQGKNQELWTPAMKAWFPKGPEDPETALLKIDVEKAEYWDTAASSVVIAIGFVKAMVTGKPYHPGENEKLDF